MTKELRVYTQPNCAPCTKSILRLEAMGVPYTALDIRQDPSLIEKHGLQSTPTFLVFDEGVEVFRGAAHQLNEALNNLI